MTRCFHSCKRTSRWRAPRDSGGRALETVNVSGSRGIHATSSARIDGGVARRGHGAVRVYSSRVHSAYSLSEGAIRIKDLAKLCVEQTMPAVAITDTNNLFGGMEFSSSMRQAGVQPIIGCQLSRRRRRRHCDKGEGRA